jgi:lipopolysaccharide/colanic/teichoic acid biosynthesis glycosyltransferase
MAASDFPRINPLAEPRECARTMSDVSDLELGLPASMPRSDFAPLSIDGMREQQIYGVVKRVLDIFLSLLLLVLFAPMFLVVAALVCIDSPGPALFVQKRVGRNGKLFDIYKFRSMHVDTPKYERSPASSRDRRITRFGRIMRRASFDELPQLINVLLGNMSLVGPRPEMPFIVERYNSVHRIRLVVAPGITGLWQLSAARSSPIHENIQYDLDYIRKRSFFLDISILIHTLFFAMRGV